MAKKSEVGCLFKAEGVNGQLYLYKDKIKISRKGMLSKLTQGLKGDKEIRIKNISSIQLKKAGAFTNGYIQFTFVGSKETKGGLFDATSDENSIMFKKKQADKFGEIKDMIYKQMDEIENKNSYQEPNTKSDGLDDLEKLAGLKEKGIITEEEFNAKKKQILGL